MRGNKIMTFSKESFMPKQKKDIITNTEFTTINNPPRKKLHRLPNETNHDDENVDHLKETLIGMEYDLDPGEDEWEEEWQEEKEQRP
jgi:hypothetical protein